LLAGVTRQTISSIETGQYNPSALLALLLARCLDKRVEDLFSLEEEKS
jgi:putative transcriptional regulator